MRTERLCVTIIILLSALLVCTACMDHATDETAQITERAPSVSQGIENRAAPDAGADSPDDYSGQTETPLLDEGQESDESTDNAFAEEAAASDIADSTPEPQPSETGHMNADETAPEDITPPESLAPAPIDDEPVVLTISGDGVTGETHWTLSRLKSLREGYREFTYSTTNNWPNFGRASAHGISLPYLLQQSGISDNAMGCRLTATDGYTFTVTRDQIFNPGYSYAVHSSDGSSEASRIEPVIAWEWGDDSEARPENLRSFFGQSGPMEVNTLSFVRELCMIEVFTAYPGTWGAPDVSIAAGSVVPFGTELQLIHDRMDSVRIYYTLDGSEPDYNSAVYNPSTTFFQPHLIKPLFLAESVTIKAFTAGLGKDPSPVVTFDYIVEA